MTNHSETTGPFENGDISGQEPLTGLSAHDTQVTLRTPAELADALPYLLGYRPEDSMVLVALHDREGRGRFGGRARLGIPADEEDWEAAARQLAHGLVTGSERRGARPEQMVAYVCQEPAPGESGRDVKRRLERLAHLLRTQCGERDVPVIEALCISDGRFWSYCCPVESCCPEDGSPMGLPGTSVLAAAATYAGIQVRGTLRELRARLQPWETTAALEQEIALDTAGMTLVPRILDEVSRAEVAQETLDLAERIIDRFAAAAPVSGTHPADLRDDRLLAHDEAATLILGLQDRTTRDRAAAWMEGDAAGPALRLWRALARRCVGPYGEHAAAPLTLAGWVAWSTGDELEAREALAMALGADPEYLFARLLHQACNEGLDPEAIRRCLRADRADRVRRTPADTGSQSHAEEKTTPAELPAAEDATGTTRADDQGGDEVGRETGTRRRRRVRPADGGDARRAARPTGGRRRPAGSHPGPSAAEPSRPGSRGLGDARTRAAEQSGTTAGSPLTKNDHRKPEGEA
ncbi:hypothetical protein SRB17_63740 [Streptomyces sp. RB17]|uniref:DUF4192 domain-containing protein n=1 Tax=Streptomyces sp. RB17 TaxID=2585197 RepID=UPI0012957706|nr:DUF4192 domain-containing protein [Streptomyces sp. RB17]MQY38361.1 hypothetical protein [Streptomyces sp. RB17]